MAIEIERKFLIKNESWKDAIGATYLIEQAYLSTSKEAAVRIRTSNAKAYLTIKGKTTSATRQEYEYEIPFQDAQELLQLCETSIRKIRYHVWLEQHLWEIDVFSGSNEGLILAEIELNDENEVFKKPSWLGDEVTSDSRYYNVNLLKNPFKNWHH